MISLVNGFQGAFRSGRRPGAGAMAPNAARPLERLHLDWKPGTSKQAALARRVSAHFYQPAPPRALSGDSNQAENALSEREEAGVVLAVLLAFLVGGILLTLRGLAMAAVWP